MYMCIYMYIYIYIYRERERDRCIIYVYIYIHTYIHIHTYTHAYTCILTHIQLGGQHTFSRAFDLEPQRPHLTAAPLPTEGRHRFAGK